MSRVSSVSPPTWAPASCGPPQGRPSLDGASSLGRAPVPVPVRASLATRRSSPSGDSAVSSSPLDCRLLGSSRDSGPGSLGVRSETGRPAAVRVRRTLEPTVSSVGFACSPSLAESPATSESLFKAGVQGGGVRSGLLRRELSGDVHAMCLETNDGAQLVIQPAVRRKSQKFEDLPSTTRSSPTPSVESLLAEAVARHEIFSTALVRKAFCVAANAHEGQTRKDGSMVISHVFETALLLAKLGLDETVIAAALLHDTLDDTQVTEEQLRGWFSSEVVSLVLGVSKMSEISQLHRESERALTELEVDSLRAMMLAMVDIRVVLIKLADRLHNMRTVSALAPPKQRRMAAETLAVFAPLANRLGVWSIKAELEDLCFAVLHPEEFAELSAHLRRQAEQADIIAALNQVSDALTEAQVEVVDLSGRPKNLYSVWQKMSKKGVAVHDILDARAIRVIVRDKAACYSALRAVQRLWAPLEDRTKDYIRQPKPNKYRSLHTVVRDSSGRPLEVQIRTSYMHAVAEYGVAAHWRYKEGRGAGGAGAGGDVDANQEFVDQQVAWARLMVSWGLELADKKAVSACLPPSLSGGDKDERAGPVRPSACSFPQHAAECSYNPDAPGCDPSAKLRLPLELRGAAPTLILLLQSGRLQVVQLPASPGPADLAAAVGDSWHSPAARVLVNGQPRDDLRLAQDGEPLRLEMGDLLQVDDGAQEEQFFVDCSPTGIAAERARLFRQHAGAGASVGIVAA